MTLGPQLRDAIESDLPCFFAFQSDPIANRIAAFPARAHAEFMTHWKRILADADVIKQTVVFEDKIVGYIVCYKQGRKHFVGYWIGREFWGRGIATQAVATLISLVAMRPLYAYVSQANRASIRVLEKCSFRLAGETASAAPTGGPIVKEFLYCLSE